MSDYREPKAGEWVLVSSVEEGDVACLRVERVTQEPDERPMLNLGDVTTWLADTGEPLNRSWRGHRIRVATTGEIRAKIRETAERVANDGDEAALSKVCGMLLEVLR